MLTTVTTLKQQQRNVLDYLTAAMRAHLHGHAAPSLLHVLIGDHRPDSPRR